MYVPLHTDVMLSPDPPQSEGGDGSFKSGELPIGEFETRFGIAPLDFGASSCASLTVHYYSEPARQLDTLFEVDAGECNHGSTLTDSRPVEMTGFGGY